MENGDAGGRGEIGNSLRGLFLIRTEPYLPNFQEFIR